MYLNIHNTRRSLHLFIYNINISCFTFMLMKKAKALMLISISAFSNQDYDRRQNWRTLITAQTQRTVTIPVALISRGKLKGTVKILKLFSAGFCWDGHFFSLLFCRLSICPCVCWMEETESEQPLGYLFTSDICILGKWADSEIRIIFIFSPPLSLAAPWCCAVER